MKLYVFKKLPKIDFENEYLRLPPSRKAKVDALKNSFDKKVSTFEYVFLKKKLNLADGEDFSYTKNGRPYVTGKTDFSITNSNVLCVAFFDDGIGGVDGEFVKKYQPSFAKMICNEKELKQIERAKDKDKMFTKLFTRKEATLKCLDLNINNDLKNIIGDFEYHTFEKIVSGNRFIVSVCEKKNS